MEKEKLEVPLIKLVWGKKNVTKMSTMLSRVTPQGSYANVLEKLRKKADRDASRTRIIETSPNKKEDIHI